MTTEAQTRNPSAERHQFREDMRAARVARDTMRGNQMRGRAEMRALEERKGKLKQDEILGVEHAEQELAAVVERIRDLRAADEELDLGIKAAEAIIDGRQGQLRELHTDPECFPFFVREANSATAAAERDLRAVAQAVARARESWQRAETLWRPLNAAIRERLEALNASEGRYPDVPPQAAVPPFPVHMPSDLAAMAPRPRGIDRLREAGVLE
jgi:chromosome segregation ATPase